MLFIVTNVIEFIRNSYFTLSSSAVTSPLVTIMYFNDLSTFLYHLLMKAAESCRNV